MKAGIAFILSIHCFACGWILLSSFEEDENKGILQTSEDKRVIYLDAIYFITTTITTVGYGDFKGLPNTEHNWSAQMFYLIIVTVTGILLFSVISNEIFSYKKIKTVREMVVENVGNIEEFLYEISLKVKNRNLSLDLINECKSHMKESVKRSTRFYFKGNQFYNELPARLK